MLHDKLQSYLKRIEQAITNYSNIYIERYVEEVLTSKRVNLRVRLRFNNGRLLEIQEAIVIDKEQLCHLDYRYHCQDRCNSLLFRYDSTPHFPDLAMFPHHKHLANGEVISSLKPDLLMVMQEAMNSQN